MPYPTIPLSYKKPSQSGHNSKGKSPTYAFSGNRIMARAAKTIGTNLNPKPQARKLNTTEKIVTLFVGLAALWIAAKIIQFIFSVIVSVVGFFTNPSDPSTLAAPSTPVRISAPLLKACAQQHGASNWVDDSNKESVRLIIRNCMTEQGMSDYDSTQLSHQVMDNELPP